MTLSNPALLLALITVAVVGQGWWAPARVLGFKHRPRHARVADGQILGGVTLPDIRARRPYVTGPARSIPRHVLPSICRTIVIATFGFCMPVPAEGAPSFVGPGVVPPTPGRGGIMCNGRHELTTAGWIAVFAISACSFSSCRST